MSEFSFQGIKKISGKTGAILSFVFFCATCLINWTSNHTHIADVQAEQEKRITVLEDAVKNDLATRREVDDVKSAVGRVETKLDKLIGQDVFVYTPNQRKRFKQDDGVPKISDMPRN